MQERADMQGRVTRPSPLRRTDSNGAFRPDRTDQYVGVQIRTGRRLLGMPRDTLAERLGADLQTIASYEHGSCQVPAMQMARIAEMLNKPLPWFYHHPLRADQAAGIAGQMAAPDDRLQVLLVDDAADVLVILGAFLEGAGVRVVKARSGDEALQIVASDVVLHAIVTDSVMPGLSGADLLLHAAQLRPTLPSLIVTGYAEDLKRFGDLPATVGILCKPFRREELVRRVLEMGKAGGTSAKAPNAAAHAVAGKASLGS